MTVIMDRFTLKFPSRLEEKGYMLYLSDRLARNFFATTIIIAVGVSYLIATILSTDAEPEECSAAEVWVSLVSLGLLVFLCALYALVHVTPMLFGALGLLGRELFAVAFAVLGVAVCVVISDVCFARFARIEGVLDSSYSSLMIALICTAMHWTIPVRWHLLIPVEFACVFFLPVSALTTDSPTVAQNHIFVVVLTILQILGKRHVERACRTLFSTYIFERTLRVQTEFELSAEKSMPKTGPGSVVNSEKAFNELGMTGNLLKEFERVATLGRKERWIIESEGLEVWENDVLGEGGFGKVCSANMHGTPVVVKMPREKIHVWVGEKATRLQSLGNEIRLLRRLRHPHVVSFHGVAILTAANEEGAQVPSQIGLVLERVEGLELGRCVARCSASNLVTICIGLCRAIQYLHAQDPPIIHGDLKPNNIMVEPAGTRVRAKIIDFGLARMIQDGATVGGGTRKWIAPEQVANPRTALTKALDVFALGSVIFYMEAGGPAMQTVKSEEGDTWDEDACIPWSSAAREFLSKDAREVANMCLALAPARRPERMSGLQGALERIHNDGFERLCSASTSASTTADQLSSSSHLEIVNEFEERCFQQFACAAVHPQATV